MRRSLSTNLLALLTIALLPLGLIAVFQTYNVFREAENLSRREMLRRTMEAARSEVTVILEAQGAARALASAALEIGPDSPMCSEMMNAFTRNSGHFAFAGFIEPSGLMRCVSSGNEIDFSGSDTWDDFSANPRPTIVANRQGRSTGLSVLIVSMPVLSSQNELLGTASVSIPHSLLDVLVDNEIEDLDVAIVDGDGNIMSASGEDGGKFIVDAESFAPGKLSIPLYGRVVQLSDYTSVATIPIKPFDLYVVGTWSNGSRPFATSFFSSAAPLFPIAMWLASLFVAIYAIQQLVLRHLRVLRKHMRRFSIDNLESSYVQLKDAPSEIGEIADSYNALLDRIIDDAHALAISAEEREILLKEVHHRVKNNLQLIASILNMQLRQIDDTEAQSVIRSVQQRVMSLATIHKLLYDDNKLDTIRADVLLSEIVNITTSIGRSETSAPGLELSLAPVTLDPDQAVPLALLATEAVTNSVKNTGDNGTISVTIGETEDRAVRFSVENTVDPDRVTPPPEDGSGLGSKLIKAFVTQLGGEMTVDRENGTYGLQVVFPKQQVSNSLSDAA